MRLSSTQDPRPQIVSYVVNENMGRTYKIPYCAWTNGNDWSVYDVSSQDPLMQTAILSGDVAGIALKFLSLWRVSINGDGFNSAIPPITSKIETEITAPPIPPLPPTSVVGPEWTPLTGDFPANGHPAPTEIRLPDGTTRQIRSWRGLIIEAALWLHQAGLLTHERCPIPMGGVRNLLSIDGLHKSGTKFHSPVQIGQTGLILEGSINPADSVRFARKLWLDFDKDPTQVHLRFR